MLSSVRKRLVKERPLRGLELLYFLLDQNYPINICMVLGLGGCLEEMKLREALVRLQARYWQLRAYVARQESFYPHFKLVEYCGEISLRVQQCKEEDLREELERELTLRIWTDQAPLVRCSLLRHSSESESLVLTLHHCLFDGVSARQLALELLEIVNDKNFSPASKIDQSDLSTTTYFPDPLMRLYGTGRVLARRFTEFLPRNKRERPTTSPLACSHVMDWKPKVQLTQSPSGFLEQLRPKIRNKGLTIHAAACAAQISAAAEIAGDPSSVLALSTAVNLRAYLAMPSSMIGAYFSAILTCHKFSKTIDTWDFAREVKRVLDTSLHQGDALNNASLVEHAMYVLAPLALRSEAGPRWLGRLSNFCVPPHMTISNIGSTNHLMRRDLNLKAIFFVVGGPVDWQLGSTLVGFNGTLFISFIYNSWLIDDDLATDFNQLVWKFLVELVEG